RRGGGTSRLRVGGAAEAGEDLAPDRVVPVPERRPLDARVGRPRPAPQHLVLGAEEHLRVLAVGERHEARVPVEVGGRPLPDVAEHWWRPVGPAVARGRRLPRGLGREAGAPPAGERVRLVPAQMLDGLVERESLAPAVATARPGTVALALPVLRRARARLLPPLPAAGGPEPRVVVAAVLDEGAVLAGPDRRRGDPERAPAHAGRGAGVAA